jgi:predicted permease
MGIVRTRQTNARGVLIHHLFVCPIITHNNSLAKTTPTTATTRSTTPIGPTLTKALYLHTLYADTQATTNMSNTVAAAAPDDIWEYTAVLNECIQILLTIGIGMVAGYVRVLDTEVFLPQASKFVFHIALPLHVFKGIGIGVNFYDDSFLWTFIAAFLVIRVIGLVFCFAVAFSGGGKNDGSGGTGQVAVMWLAMTWISTIILGVPIASAVFGDPIKGRTYGILASISSFIFQLPLQLFLLECNLLEKEYLSGNDDPEIDKRGDDKIPTAIGSTPPVVTADRKDDPEQPLASEDMGTLPSEDSIEHAPEDHELVQGQQVMTETEHRSISLGLWLQWARTWVIWKKILRQLARNPVLWGIIAGFFFSLTTIGPRFLNPTSAEYVTGLGWVFSTATWLGECVSPVALVAMGVWMQAQGRKLTRIPPLTAFLYMCSKLIVIPLIMLGLALLFNLNDEASRAAVLISALPISMASFSLADRYGIGQAVLSENVALGTLLILPTIILWNMALDALGLFPIAY